MKIATWNVNGIRARASQFHQWIEEEQPDLVCLQELKAELGQVPEVVRRQEYHAIRARSNRHTTKRRSILLGREIERAGEL